MLRMQIFFSNINHEYLLILKLPTNIKFIIRWQFLMHIHRTAVYTTWLSKTMQ